VIAIYRSIASDVFADGQARQSAISYSRHFLAQIAKSSDRNQKHLSMQVALVCRAFEGKGKGKFVLGQFFEADG